MMNWHSKEMQIYIKRSGSKKYVTRNAYLLHSISTNTLVNSPGFTKNLSVSFLSPFLCQISSIPLSCPFFDFFLFF